MHVPVYATSCLPLSQQRETLPGLVRVCPRVSVRVCMPDRYFLNERVHYAYVVAALLCVLGAFAIGNSDEIMTALGLAVQAQSSCSNGSSSSR